jgi:DNA-binding NarL/FixJ family response regulator
MMTEVERPKRKIFLVDDHPLVREWLANLINQQPDLAVVGEAAGRTLALEGIAATSPEAAIVDIWLEQSSGLELVKDLKRCAPKLVVLVLSVHEESIYASRALQAGAKGYLCKREATKKVIEALRLILRGRIYLGDDPTEAVLGQYAEGKPFLGSILEQLSDHELAVFEMLGQGLRTRQIAERIHLSIKTVQAYYVTIREKLNLGSATDLFRAALHHYHQNFFEG